jgi:hypothetical protein
MPDDFSVRLARSSTCVLIFLVIVVAGLSTANAVDPKKASPSWSLSVNGDLLTVNLDHIPLREVLTELGRQAHLHISLTEPAGTKLLSDAFRSLPLDEGIDRLLNGHPHAVLYENRQSAPGVARVEKIREIVVLSGEGAPSYQPDDRAKASEPSVELDAEMDATAQMNTALQDPDPAVRIKALDRWAEQGAATPLDPLTQALVDPDVSVRAKAQQLFDRALAIQGGASPLPPPPALPLESEKIPTR